MKLTRAVEQGDLCRPRIFLLPAVKIAMAITPRAGQVLADLVFNGASLLRFDGFAPAHRWEELSPANLDSPQVA
jgi:hypothetical protein